jgi:hypothetical protein
MAKANSPVLRLLPSIADLLFVLVLLLVFFGKNSTLLYDCDTGYHIRTGEYILKTLSVPDHDIFSQHTPPIPWTAHEWLAEVIMAVIHAVSGLTGIVAFFALILALTFFLLFKILRSYNADAVLASVISLLVLISSQMHWLARPHLFSFLFMIISHYLLESWYRDRSNRLYLLPFIMLLWVNLHGGFVGGFILQGAYLIGSVVKVIYAMPGKENFTFNKMRQLELTILACLAICLINPRGYHILIFPFRIVTNAYLMDHVSEFLSPDFHQWLPFKYLLLLTIAMFGLSRKSIEVTELAIILVFTHMSLYSARYIPLFALTMAPILVRNADEVQSMIDERVIGFFRTRSQNLMKMKAVDATSIWPFVAVIIVVAATISGKFPHGFDANIKAVAATEFLLKEKISGNMFNNDEFGDYLIYRGYPSYRVFFDGRSDMYGNEIMKEYSKVCNFNPGWEKVLEKHGITWIFFDSDSKLSRYLLKNPDWALVYSDKVADIFVKRLPQYRDLIAKYSWVKPFVTTTP